MPDTTEKPGTPLPSPKVGSLNAFLDSVLQESDTEIDAKLSNLDRQKILQLDPKLRLRWFYILQARHTELDRVLTELRELLEPHNETKIISLVGMTGIGKTTLADRLLNALFSASYLRDAGPHELPVVFVKAPANGDKSLSWSALYKSILYAGHEILVAHKRGLEASLTGEVRVRAGTRASLAELRQFIDDMLKHRNVRVLVIDEVFHLLRFASYSATMDTLKSLADSYETKLILIGNYDVAELVSDYGQVIRRGEIIHFRRYSVGSLDSGELTKDQTEFRRVVAKFQSLWPCETVPNLSAIWYELMRNSLGSIGLLKITLLRLAALQMRAKGELFSPTLLSKAGKNAKALQKIESETVIGEEKLMGACYGDSFFDESALERLKSVDAPPA